MKLSTALKLGRVSNLPTVWTNTLAGAVLAGAGEFGLKLFVMIVSFTLFYVGGMFLNDAFDADIDAKERPERPIPTGVVTAREVFSAGFAMMGIGVLLLLGVGYGHAFAPGTGIWPALAGLGLAGAITLYNANHKNNPFSPFVMGVCRVLIYIGAALCITSALPASIAVATILVLCYLIGLTYIAKQENLGKVENLWPLLFLAVPVIYGLYQSVGNPGIVLYCLLFAAWVGFALWLLRRRAAGDIPRAVVSLIAGISLLDAILIAGTGAQSLALLALAGFGFTLLLQRFISGT